MTVIKIYGLGWGWGGKVVVKVNVNIILVLSYINTTKRGDTKPEQKRANMTQRYRPETNWKARPL